MGSPLWVPRERDEGTKKVPPARRADDQWDKWSKRLRDLGIYMLGFCGFIYELAFRSPREPWIFGVIVLLLGLPPVIRWDEKRKEEAKPYEPPN